MNSSLWKLHIAVFLWGFTGVLGRLIELNEGLLVWYRILITVVTLFLLMWKQGALQILPFKRIMQLMGVGFIIAIHWVCFYGSIKAANVSIALTCLSSAGLFTALLEPLLLRSKFQWRELLLGLLGILGIYFIFHFDAKYQTGILIGLLATLLSVVFSILNKRLVADIAPKTMMLYELSGGWLVLTLLLPFYLKIFPVVSILPTWSDGVYLLIMSWVCTVLAMDLSLQALQKMSAFTQNLTLNLEPVYGILLAFLIFHENKELSNGFYLGAGCILLSVLLQMGWVLRTNNK